MNKTELSDSYNEDLKSQAPDFGGANVPIDHQRDTIVIAEGKEV